MNIFSSCFSFKKNITPNENLQKELATYKADSPKHYPLKKLFLKKSKHPTKDESQSSINQIQNDTNEIRKKSIVSILHQKIREKDFHRLFTFKQKELNLNHRKLKRLSHSFGKKRKSLQILRVIDNQLSTLPSSFVHMTSLEILNLNTNPNLKIIPNVVFEINSLRGIGLNECNIEEIPENITKLKNLEKLSIANNKLRNLPESISELPKLQQLDISDNPLQKLPNSLKDLKSLTHLHMKNIKTLNTEIGQASITKFFNNYPKLQQLSIQGTLNWEQIPEHICNNLRELYPHNYLDNAQEILDNIKRFKNLEKLSFHDSKLTYISEEIGELSNLEALDISNNPLEKLPDSLKNLKSLISLDMRNINTINQNIGKKSIINFLHNIPKTLKYLKVDGTLTWEEIQKHIPNNDFNRLNIDVCPEGQMVNYIDDNTHQRSHHIYSSLCAATLYAQFPDINFKDTIDELRSYIEKLPKNGAKIENGVANPEFINTVAEQFLHGNNFCSDEKEQYSDINLKEFLALFWKAIHSEEHRYEGSTLDDTKRIFLDGLYEIERGNNIDNWSNKDDGKSNNNICEGGAFNKVYEKVCLTLKNIEMRYVTKASIENSIFASFRNSEKGENGVEGFYKAIKHEFLKRIKNTQNLLIYDLEDKTSRLDINDKEKLNIITNIIIQSVGSLLSKDKIKELYIDIDDVLKKMPINIKRQYTIHLEKINDEIHSYMPSLKPESSFIQNIVNYLKLEDFPSDIELHINTKPSFIPNIRLEQGSSSHA